MPDTPAAMKNLMLTSGQHPLALGRIFALTICCNADRPLPKEKLF